MEAAQALMQAEDVNATQLLADGTVVTGARKMLRV